MTLKIERSARPGLTVFTLSGRIEGSHIAQLQELISGEAAGESMILDLKEVRLADRDAVAFLARCEANGVQLRNCPPYIREWIESDEDRRQRRT